MNYRTPYGKGTLIERYLLPMLGKLPDSEWVSLGESLEHHCQLRQSVSGQYLIEPSPASEVRAIIMPQSVAHSFQVIAQGTSHRHVGTHIWPRRTLIFQPTALLEADDCTDYVQALEPGPYLSISYAALKQLMAKHPVLDRGISVLSRQQERQRQAHDHLLRLPPVDRVMAFERLYPSFCHVASIESRCVHTALSRQTYSKKLKIINSPRP